jgi:hypothetical protein
MIILHYINLLLADFKNKFIRISCRGTRYRSWLRHYATSRKVANSYPDEVIDFFFNLPNRPSRTMALDLTQPNRNKYRKIFLGSRARTVRRVDNLTANCGPII